MNFAQMPVPIKSQKHCYANMHRNIWLFGGSYAGDPGQDANMPTYYSLLRDHFGCQLFNCGKSGSSLTYTYITFNEVRHKIQKNDIILVCLTEPSRQNFFSDRPEVSAMLGLHFHACTDYEKDAMEKYMKYLHNASNDANTLVNFLYNLQCATEDLSLTTICMPLSSTRKLLGYPNLKDIPTHDFSSLVFPTGFLFDIPDGEASDSDIRKLIYGKFTGYYDPRINHMCMSNHKIMATKLIDTIETGCALDFTNGFRKNILTIESLNSDEFRSTELRPGINDIHIPYELRL